MLTGYLLKKSIFHSAACLYGDFALFIPYDHFLLLSCLEANSMWEKMKIESKGRKGKQSLISQL